MDTKKHIYVDERGFTLMELLVVIVILGLLAGIVMTSVTGKVDKAKITAAKTQISQFVGAIEQYKLDTGIYPTTQEGLKALVENPGVQGWNGPYLTKKVLPKDPWMKDYKYTYPGQHGEYDVYTYGMDDAPGGDGNNQDIANWN